MITVVKENTASFDVDPQKGFTPLCPKELPVTDGENIVEELNKQSRLASVRLGSKDAHCIQALHTASQEAPQFTPVNLPNVDIKWNMHCVMGTPGAELLEGLPHWSKYDFFVWKGIEPDTHPYGAIYHDAADKISTGAKEFLKSKGIKTVIVGGLATDFCVKKTVLSLLEAEFEVILNLGACRGINAPNRDGTTSLTVAMEAMQAAGAKFVISSDELESI